VYSLAYLEMRLVLGKLLWNFDIAAAPGKPEWTAIQSPKLVPAWIVWHKPELWTKLTLTH
jgi:cytochrome P450